MSKVVTYVEIDTPAFPVTSPMGPDKTWRFAEPTEYLPRDIDCIPSVASVSYNAAVISLGENLGQRASLTVTLRDHRHVVNAEPFDQGTFWGKFRARYGQKLRGRSVRLIRGVAGQALDDMDTRYFFVDSTDGPTPDGTYTIVAKDLLKFADDDRAKAPALSNGSLAGSIDDDDAAATLTPTGIGDEEYPASGHICIGGKEIVAFTRSGDTLTITRAQLGTTAIAHSAGDRAQLVLYYDGDDVADIIADLLENYAAIDPAYIPIADWQAETADQLGGVLYARPVTEPTSVGKLVGELVEQAALAVWWDERAQIVRLQVLKEIATDAELFDEDVILDGTLKVKDQPDKRISQIWTYYAQRNPADRGDNDDNYRSALATVDLERETDYGGPVVRTIKGAWIPTINAAERLNQVQVSRFRDPPRKFAFDLFHGSAISAGGGYRLRWRQNQDTEGNIVEEGAPIQVTRVAIEPGVIHVEAEEMLASGVIVITKTVILTTEGGLLNWTVADDWNDADNAIHCIGAGGGGGGGGPTEDGSKGGGGGAYSGITNLSLTPSSSVQYRIGSPGTGGNVNTAGTAGSDTWFNGATLGAASVGAKGGTGGNPGIGAGSGIGGQASSGIGDTKTSGGDGGAGYNQGDLAGGGGGGGAAGPNGNGAVGGGDPGIGGEDDGGGGGGANGGSASSDSRTGGNNRFGFGGGNDTTTVGQEGGGGRGGSETGIGTDVGASGGGGEPLWTQTIAPIISAGPAGGGGGGSAFDPGGTGGLYGGGGGGGGCVSRGGNGAQGVIAIVWRPAV